MGAARSIGSAKIVIRHASVAVKLFTAATRDRVSFNRLHKGCGSRITQGLRCATEDKPVEWADLENGFQYEPDKFVSFSAEELKGIGALLDDDTIELVEFVPESSIDPVDLDKTYLLGPEKGCASAYRVIAQALMRRRSAGVGNWGGELAVVRYVDQGLVVHTAYFANEKRSLGDILEDPPAAPVDHVRAAERLIQAMAKDSFDAVRFTDRYAAKIAAAVKEKIAGKKVIVPPRPKTEAPLGLLEALERSVAAAGPVKAGARKRGKAA